MPQSEIWGWWSTDVLVVDRLGSTRATGLLLLITAATESIDLFQGVAGMWATPGHAVNCVIQRGPPIRSRLYIGTRGAK